MRIYIFPMHNSDQQFTNAQMYTIELSTQRQTQIQIYFHFRH